MSDVCVSLLAVIFLPQAVVDVKVIHHIEVKDSASTNIRLFLVVIRRRRPSSAGRLLEKIEKKNRLAFVVEGTSRLSEPRFACPRQFALDVGEDHAKVAAVFNLPHCALAEAVTHNDSSECEKGFRGSMKFTISHLAVRWTCG